MSVPGFGAAGKVRLGWLGRDRQDGKVAEGPLRSMESAEESLTFRHYLSKEVEERTAFRRLRERQVEPVLDFLNACSERVIAQLHRSFIFEVYERSLFLKSGITRDAFYAEVAPLGLDRAGARSLLPAFFSAVAASPDKSVRNVVFKVWEEVMTSRPSEDVVETIDRMRHILLDYIVRGQEIGVAHLSDSERVGETDLPVVVDVSVASEPTRVEDISALPGPAQLSWATEPTKPPPATEMSAVSELTHATEAAETLDRANGSENSETRDVTGVSGETAAAKLTEASGEVAETDVLEPLNTSGTGSQEPSSGAA